MALKAVGGLGIVLGSTYHAWRLFARRPPARAEQSAESDAEEEVLSRPLGNAAGPLPGPIGEAGQRRARHRTSLLAEKIYVLGGARLLLWERPCGAACGTHACALGVPRPVGPCRPAVPARRAQGSSSRGRPVCAYLAQRALLPP